MKKRLACSLLVCFCAGALALGACRDKSGARDAKLPGVRASGDAAFVAQFPLQNVVTLDMDASDAGLQELEATLWPRDEKLAVKYQPMAPSAQEELLATIRRLWTCETTEQKYLLRETADLPTGQGFYLFRCAQPDKNSVQSKAPPRILLQAPHPYFDKGSETLALQWFWQSDETIAPQALFAASAHRYAQVDGSVAKQTNNPLDVCHNSEHVFTDATLAVTSGAVASGFAAADFVVQVHGFSAESRDWNADVVISNGSTNVTPVIREIAAALTQLGLQVLIYPEHTNELGAVTNVQGRALRESGFGGEFIHLELSERARATWQSNASSRADACKAIVGAMRKVHAPR